MRPNILTYGNNSLATFVLILVPLLAEQRKIAYAQNPYHRIVNLDLEGRYVLEWLVNWTNNTITFNLTVATTGYIGFGLSERGNMSGADFIIGGVDVRHVPYLVDMHGSPNQENKFVRDISQDYSLHNAWENGTHTSLQFSRQIKTSDELHQDYTIDNNTVTILWGIGENGNDFYEYPEWINKGIYRLYLLDPDLTPWEFQQANRARRLANSDERGELQVWTVTRHQVVPVKDTAYWCSFHKGPELQTKHHLVGFNFRRENEIEYNRTHHLLLFRCQAPNGQDPKTFFEQYVQNSTGEMCYFFQRGPSGNLPLQYCRDLVYAYAIGAGMFFLPNHTGIPIGYNLDEFYLLQVHYDNFDARSDLEYTINIDLFYTENLRKNEGGVASIGHHIPGSLSILVPPETLEHNIYGHCASQCTRQMFPPEGIIILGVQHHTHLSGRRHRTQHFRNGKELPWIINDDNYDGNYQAIRMQLNEIRVMPGDHLITRCAYDSTWKNGSVVGGFSTRQEMCLTYIWYSNRMNNYYLCRSEIYDVEEYIDRHLGVKNYTWSDEYMEYEATEPATLAGMAITQVADNIEWTTKKIEELQRDQLLLPQRLFCPTLGQLREGQSGELVGEFTKYPVGAEEYIPPKYYVQRSLWKESKYAKPGISRVYNMDGKKFGDLDEKDLVGMNIEFKL